MKERRKADGFRSIVVFLPTIVTIIILYALILVSTIIIDVDTTQMTQTNQEVTDCIDQITNLQSRSSKLSSTAISFTHMPTFPDPAKTLNTNALNAYMSEFDDSNKKVETIIDNLAKYGYDKTNPEKSNNYFNEESSNLIKDVFEAANSMELIQAHAFRLINTMSYVNLPPENVLNKIPQYTLSNEETSLSDNEKQAQALELLLDRNYSINQELISENIKEATNSITSLALQRNNDISFRIKFFRGFLWSGILLILLANIALFIILLKKLVFPIVNFSKRIDDNERLDERHALYEPNYLAKAYNRLLDRHKEFEDKLREVAEIDSLTLLPNRNYYNEFLLKEITEDKSSCVFLLDINNLKYVNDTFGHSKGDELIKRASLCIKESFLDESGKNCYRIGGDEFVAIIDNIEKDSIDKLIEDFNEKQKQYSVSIAIGYSYSENVKETGYEKLIMDADRKMYINKELYKKSQQEKQIVC